MNKLLISVFALAFPLSSMAAAGIAACTPGATPVATAMVQGTHYGPLLFIRNPFEIKCSSNVNLKFTQSGVGVGVGSNSLKGKKSFNGSSLGGAVAAQADCTGACTADMAETALQAIPGIGSL